MQNKKGLSDIVVTLIIIVLSLVAIGVVWVVVNNMLKGGTASADIGVKCIGVQVSAIRANCSDATSNVCTVSLSRTGTESSPIGGVKLVFRNQSAGVSSGVIDVSGDVAQLAGSIVTRDTGVAKTAFLGNFSTVEVTAYFTDAAGKQQICQQTSPFNFVS